MSSAFFALISRMKHISRWGLMRNNVQENVQEHSHTVAVLAHALAVIRRDVFGVPCEPERAAAAALYHDASEILTGDLPTPIKYNNAEIMSAYREVERLAAEKLVALLPGELRPAYRPLLSGEDEAVRALVKGADKLAAYVKCVEERRAGNDEFLSAERQTRETLEAMDMPELKYFMDTFIPAYELTLDEVGVMGELENLSRE